MFRSAASLSSFRSKISVCSLNIRSLSNSDHIIAVHDLAASYKFDCFAFSETFLSAKTSPCEIMSIPPPGYEMFIANRDSKLAGARGGGVALLFRKPFTLLSTHSYKFASFETISATVKFSSCALHVVSVYRPPNTSTYAKPFSVFLSEFSAMLSSLTATKSDFVITGDLNIHVDQPLDPMTQQFNSLLSSCNATQHVSIATHSDNHTLDLVITPTVSALDPTSVTILPYSPSDHFPVVFSFNHGKTNTVSKSSTKSFRCINSIDMEQFCFDLETSTLTKFPPADLDELVNLYNTTLSALLDKHAPLTTKTIKESNPWFTSDLKKLKAACRRADRKWRQTHSSVWKTVSNLQYKMYRSAIANAKRQYYSSAVSNAVNSRNLWKTVNGLLHRSPVPSLPSLPTESLPNQFACYFSDKISNLRSSITRPTDSYSTPHFPSPTHSSDEFSVFSPVTTEEITKIVLGLPDKQCNLDPIPTSLLKKCIHLLSPTLTKIINLSLSSSKFPQAYKHAIVTPLLKKPTLDKESLSNYRPISNLSFVSKLTERVVLQRLSVHLSSNDLFNKHQSAYTKHRSTETVLLSVCNTITNAMSNQRITGLCMLDLSAAFDTIDHSILLERLSCWFGIRGSVLSWFTSYLKDRTLSVKIHEYTSSPMCLQYGVPQGSVLGPILFNLYTTPLSSLISSHPLDHELFADDSQMYTCFTPNSYSDAVCCLQQTFQSVSSWMSANFLALNPSKTEFMLFGTPQQLLKLKDPCLSISSDISIAPISSVKNLGVVFDKHLSFHEHITKISQACFFHIRDLRRIRPYLSLATATTIGAALVQSKLDYCNSLLLNLPDCEIDRLQFVQNSLARAIYRCSKYSHVTPILKALHWLKVKERIVYKTVSLTYKSIVTPGRSYMSHLIEVKQPATTRSSKLITLERPSIPSRCKLSNRSFQHAAPQIWNSLPSTFRTPSYSAHLPSLSYDQFHKQLKTYLFDISFPSGVLELRPTPKPPFL